MKLQINLMFFVTVVGLLTNGCETPQDEIKLKAKAIHPEWRTDFSPSNCKALVNPPALFAPTKQGQQLRSHDFQLASDRNFKSVVAQVTDHEPSFFLPEKPLTKGSWYWRFRLAGEDWKGPFTFDIDESTRINDAPSGKEFVESIPDEHPRVLIRKARLADLRRELAGSDFAMRVKKNAEQYLDVVLAKKNWGGKFFKDGKRVFAPTKFPPNHPKSQPTGKIFTNGAYSLCMAYIVTGDKQYGEEAVRWGLQVAEFSPYVGQHDSFSSAFLLDTLAVVYDTCYGLLKNEQRIAMKMSLASWLDSYYRYYCNRLECRVLDAHAWQISMRCFLDAALAVKGHYPPADKYLKYFYNLWQARFPVQSTTDGGWHNGNYFAVNISTWISVAATFRKFTGYNYYQHPWFRNHAKWHLYRQPPGSASDGFGGDNYERDSRGVGTHSALWLKILDADLDCPLARWLAETASEAKGGKYDNDRWCRISEELPLKSCKPVVTPTELPQAELFRDVGVANMNLNILNPQENLMVSLRSDPWGNFGHNLCSQNAFTVVYQGEPLFVPFRHRHGGAKHAYMCYRHTRGHNSVLVEGNGQPISSDAYGWIPRFLHGEKISYVCGDASNAYDGTPSPQWFERVKKAGIKWTEQMGCESLQRFRRHLLFLRPSLIVIYDELEAEQPVRWDWLLHCRKTLNACGSVLTVDGTNATADIRASQPLKVEIQTKPLVAPFNVDRRGGKTPTVYKSRGSYAYVTPIQKSNTLRVLALIQVGEQSAVTKLNEGSFQIGAWLLKAEMDTSKPANLHIHNKQGTAKFTLKSKDTGESIIKEQVGNKTIVRKTADVLPLAARGLAK